MRRCQIWHRLNHRRGVNLSLRSRRILRHLNNDYMQRDKTIDTRAERAAVPPRSAFPFTAVFAPQLSHTPVPRVKTTVLPKSFFQVRNLPYFLIFPNR